MKCKTCGCDNPVDAQFCRQCGLKINSQFQKIHTYTTGNQHTTWRNSFLWKIITLFAAFPYVVAFLIAVTIMNGQEGSFENFIIVAIITAIVGFILSRIVIWLDK